jgi:hypothetical protein
MISPHRSKKHLAFVRGRRCAFCANPAAEAHHTGRLVGGGGIGIKPCDLLAAPLCRDHHRELHKRGTIGTNSPSDTLHDLWRAIALCLRDRLAEMEGA